MKAFILQATAALTREDVSALGAASQLVNIEMASKGESGYSLATMLKSHTAPAMLFINGDAGTAAIQSMLTQLGSLPATGMTVFTAASEDGEEVLPAMTPSAWMQRIAYQTQFPLVGLYCDASGLQDLSDVIATSPVEYLVAVACASTGQGLFVEERALKVKMDCSLELANSQWASILRHLVASANIEELFPSLAWSAHSKESAAAAYHSLTALFIKFGDVVAANECIALSDNFEDSPRALALRGMIAMMEGETLAAVANMVSSLQQYEISKNGAGSHYLSFTPKSFDQINDSLKAGLEALNQRDNLKALAHFGKAVINFDPFYKEWGIAHVI